MSKMNIANISITMTVEGVPCILNLDQKSLLTVVNMSAGFSENKKLNVIKLPDDYKLEQLFKVNG